MSNIIAVRQHIAALRFRPQFRELRIPDEYLRASRCIRTILEIVHPAVQQQRRAPGVEKNRRKRIILAVQNQLTSRGIEERLRERPRPEVWVELNERQQGGMKT